MQQESIVINKIRLTYYKNGDIELTKPSLVFLHGNSLSSLIFKKQFDSELTNQFNLVALDFPGHGGSANSKNPEDDYNIKAFAKIVHEFINNTNITNPILVGHSLGGHVAIESLNYRKDIRGLVIIGTPPISPEKDFNQYVAPPGPEDEYQIAWLPHPAMSFLGHPNWTNEENTVFYESLWGMKQLEVDEIKNAIKKADGKFREHLISSVINKNFWDEPKLLQTWAKSVMVIHGQDDKLVNDQYIKMLKLNLWNSEIHYITNTGHIPFYENPELFNSVFVDYCRSML